MIPLAIDEFVVIALIVVTVPVLVIGGLAMAARWRGPVVRPESRLPVESLVTDAIPEEHADPGDVEDDGTPYSIDSPPPAPDPGLRRSGDEPA